MKNFQKFAIILGLALAISAQADSYNYSGTVIDDQGHAVTGAAVDYYHYPSGVAALMSPEMETNQHTNTDGKGMFAFSSSKASAIVVVKKAGMAVAWKTWSISNGNTSETMVLTAPTTLAGVVVDENGQPVSDAEVSVSVAITGGENTQQNILFGNPAKECFSTHTSLDGGFSILNFPADAQASLAVGKSGKALQQISTSLNGLPYRSGQQNIKLVLEPAGNIEGHVIVGGTGQPLAGAKLQLQASSGGYRTLEFHEAAESDADGAFHISDVAAGSYVLTATFDGQPVPDWVAKRVSVTVVAGETARDAQVEASKGGILEVTVLSKDDRKPMANVNVMAFGASGQMSATTDTNGVSLLRLLPGQTTIAAISEGFAQTQIPATVEADKTNRVQLDVTAPLKIAGVVRDASGAPVAGTRLSVFPNYGGRSQAISDSNGRYEIVWQQPQNIGMQNRTFFLIARSFERNLATVHEIVEKTTNLDLNLEPGMTVSARVQDAKGRPIPSAVAYLMFFTENMGSSIGSQDNKADDLGVISVSALPPGQRYGLNVSAKGYGSANQQMDAADVQTNYYEFSPFTLNLADRKLAGRVLGTDGKPVAGAQVQIYGEGQPNDSVQTDAKGNFSFNAVCEGPVNISAYSQQSDGNGFSQTSGGDTNVVIRFNVNNNRTYAVASVTITGTVFDTLGAPDAEARVTLTPAFGMNSGAAKTDDKGHYSFAWQPQPGLRNIQYFLIARDLDHNLAVAQRINEKETNVDLHLESGFTLSGTVEDSDGAPLGHASVNLNFMAGNNGGLVDTQPLQSDARGDFTITALPAGQRYNLFVNSKGYGSANKLLQSTDTQAASLRLPPFRLKLADRPLAGQVVGSDDKPVVGAQVQINGRGQPNTNTRTDSTGHFAFKVCEGPVQVFAYSQNNGQFIQGQSQTVSGDTNVIVKIGINQPRIIQSSRGLVPLKEPPWTFRAVVAWFAGHQKTAICLVCLQWAALAGTAGGILWCVIRKPTA